MITLSFHSWMIPAFITVAGFFYALFIYDDGSATYGSGLGNLLLLAPVSIVSAISWIIWAVFK